MSAHRRSSPPAAVAAAAAHRPRLVIVIAVVVLALSAVSLGRMRMATSLDAMLGDHSESARAFQRVMNEFHATESLLVHIEPAPQSPATSADAARFADLLVESLRFDPRTRDRIAWASSRRDDAVARFAAEQMTPHAPYYLGEIATRELIDRFRPERLARQFARNEAMIVSPGPVGDALSRAVLRDPLRLFELAADAGLGAIDIADAGAREDPPHEFSIDGAAVLVRIASVASISELEETRQLVQRVGAIADELRESSGLDGLSVRLGGPGAIATVSSTTIRADAITATVLSITLIYALFVFFSRRWLPPLIIGVGAGAGLAAGFAVHALFQPAVSPLATVIAALLAGLGVDYGVHFVSHFDALRARGESAPAAAAETACVMAMPITANCFTSIFGFIALWPSQIQMLSDFARLGAAGLLGAWVSVFTLLPAMLVLSSRGAGAAPTRGPRFGGLADVALRRPRALLSTALVLLATVLVIIVAHPAGPELESDLTVLHPRPNEALDTTGDILRSFSGQGEMIPVLLDAPRHELLLPGAIDAARALTSEACRAVGVVEVFGLHRLLPDPRRVDAVRAVLEGADADTLLRNFDDALENSPFDPSAYTAYRVLLRDMLTGAAPPDVAALGAHPSIARRLLPTASLDSDTLPRRTVLVVRLDQPLRDRAHRGAVFSTLRDALGSASGARLASLDVVAEELEAAAGRDLPRSIGISSVLVLCWLAIMLRRPADVAFALTPPACAALAVIAFLTAFEVRLNPITIIAFPLLFGIAVDAGVFLVAGARRARADGVDRVELARRLRPTMHAILLAAATTMTGFLSLCVADTPAIRSLGILAAIGVAASFCAAAALLAPWILSRAPRNRA